jgi:gamma-glutamylcyclotransferase
MLYFAYGSNMNWEQMKLRCPSASFLCKAVLKDYKIALTRKSLKGYGVADIVPSHGNHVWGVVYKIDDIDLGFLDTAEGYYPNRLQNAYKRIEIIVFAEANKENPLTMFTYEVVEKEQNEIPTVQEYKNKILEGAKFWHLPEEYIKKFLDTIPTK